MNRRFCMLLAIISLEPSGVFAQDCDPNRHTANECINIIGQRISAAQNNLAEYKEVSEADISNARRDLRVATTGDVAINVLGSPVSLNDLLPVFNIAVEPGTAGDSEESTSIAIEYSPTREILGGDLKASVLAKSPQLADPAKDAINDQTISEEIESGLDYSDDITLALTYSYSGTIGGLQIGRTDVFYSELMDGMLAAANAEAPSIENNLIGSTLNALIRAYGNPWQAEIVQVMRSDPYGRLEDWLRKTNRVIFNDEMSRVEFVNGLQNLDAVTKSTMADTFANCEGILGEVLVASADAIDALSARYATCLYSGFVDKLETSVAASLDRTENYNQFLTDNGFFKLGALVNNQPQLLFVGTAQFRDPLAGGDNIGAKLTFEFDLSGHNINNLNNHLRRDRCSGDVAKSGFTMSIYSQCSTQIRDYIVENPITQGGWRGSLNVEYRKRDNLNLNLPTSMTPLFVEGGDSVIASFVAGRQFQLLEKSGLPKGKVDIGFSYDNVSDDPTRQDRALGTITFTQQLAPAAQLSIGLVWANKSEFRGDVDEELTAKIGLNYKFANIGSER